MMRARVEPPSDGLLSTTIEFAPTALPVSGKYFSPSRIFPEASSQFSTNVPCNACTASPVIENIVSRHGGSCFSPCHHWSETPAPPTNASFPSITISSRCVRLLVRGQLYHRTG